MAKKQKKDAALAEMLEVASGKDKSSLILSLAAHRPDIRRECFDFLKSQVSLSDVLQKRSESEAIIALWDQLAPDLQDLDAYGGGDYDTEDHVAELLDGIRERLESKKVELKWRKEILKRILPYIKSGNSGMTDMLYEVAYATCYDNDDLNRFARLLEAMQTDWEIENARRIYRDLGNRDKYLELRHRRLSFGGDYHDLATFYWDCGEKQKALEVAETGLKKGQGRMDELRKFLASRAKETGNREKYIEIQFEQTTDDLTFKKYKAFKKLCSLEEWTHFEPMMLARMKKAWRAERIKIHMHRKEYEKAVAILIKGRYPLSDWDDTYEIQAAKKLEKRYPEEILKYYLSGLGNMKSNATRKEYTRKSKVMAKVRQLMIAVLDDELRWQAYASEMKQANIRRPAFQDEFAKNIPGWREID